MKKTKMWALLLVTLLSLFCLTACGSNKNNAGTGTSAPQATTGANTESSGNNTGNTSGNTQGSTSGTTAAGSLDKEESSPGVIEGLMDDVEEGVEDLTGNDSSRASDESKQ